MQKGHTSLTEELLKDFREDISAVDNKRDRTV